MKHSEKILLYWSGEADEAIAREVEALLESDESARAYLDELNELGAGLRDAEVPARRPGLLDEVLDEQAAKRKTIGFPTKAAIASAAAVLVGLLVLNQLVGERDQPVTPTVADPPPQPAPEVQQPTLSERLLSRSGSFRGGSERLRDSLRQRSRWQKLQIQRPSPSA